MNYNNFSISAGKGKLFLKEKAPKEGYEEITYGADNKKTYHKYFTSIKGTPKYFDTKEVKFDGKTLRFLELTLIDGEDSNKVSVPLKNTKGNYTDETRAIISSLNSLKLGEEVVLSVKTSTSIGKNGKEYKNLNVYINYTNILNDDGKGQSTGFIPYTEIPGPESKVVAGDQVWDWTAQTEFFYNKLEEIKARFSNAPTAYGSTSTAKPMEVTTVSEMQIPKIDSVTIEDDFELPF